tara:strand:- start:1702 stop:2130 length:429 start_codon:yes stop_codon:yes gene_type:complete
MGLPVRDDVCAALAVTTAVVVLAMIGKAARGERARAPQITRAARELLGQSQTWSDMAAQDQESLYKLQHTCMAAAYANAARVLAADDELLRASNIDVHQKLRELEAAQRKLVSKMSKGTPSVVDKAKVAKAKGTDIGGSSWL